MDGLKYTVHALDQWHSFVISLGIGAVTVGSRQAVEGVPVWATPEVMWGGFATGNLIAEVKKHPLVFL